MLSIIYNKKMRGKTNSKRGPGILRSERVWNKAIITDNFIPNEEIARVMDLPADEKKTIAKDPTTHPLILAAFLKSYDWLAKETLGNPSLPLSALHAYIQTDFTGGYDRILRNPALTQTELQLIVEQRMKKDPRGSVDGPGNYRVLLNHPLLTSEMLEYILEKSESEALIRQVITHPKLSSQVLETEILKKIDLTSLLAKEELARREPNTGS